MRDLVGDAGTVEIADCAPPGKVVTDHPWVQELLTHNGGLLRPKQAWTDVGRFSAWGVDAISFGPGDPAQAHQRGEWASIAAMVEHHRILEQLLGQVRRT